MHGDMNIRPAHEIRLGDALTVLRSMESESVQCCVTSPPYFGLRDYGTANWEGGSVDCDHKARPGGGISKGSSLAGTSNRGGYSSDGQCRQRCDKCGAVRIDKQIGLEATPAEFVAKMVEVFEEVRRVLKKDGTLWLNLGDSYNGIGGPGKQNGGAVGPTAAIAVENNRGVRIAGLKMKDLIGIPWRVAFALQEAGWWLRQDIIWSKPNPMPESVTDRCTKAHEYMFLLTKSAKYFYDAEAVKEEAEAGTLARNLYKRTGYAKELLAQASVSYLNPKTTEYWEGETRNKRSVWTVTTQPYSEAHFATFPPKLIEPCILAGSREGDTVLDPFNGSGTTGLVSLRHRRNYIGIELNPEYIKIAEKRLSDVQVKLF